MATPVLARAAVGLLVAIVALGAGCMALPKRETAVFDDPLLEQKGTLPLRAGLMTLKDARPPEQREGFGDIEYFPERVTLVMLMDFSEARLFTSLNHVKVPQESEVLLRGEIRSFEWTPKHDWVPYLPALGILAAFGVPVAHSTMEVEIALDVVNPKKDEPIASYAKAATTKQSYFVYRFQDFRAGSTRDKDSAFRQVAVQLQTAILDDRERIIAAVK
jgi:hypothetical protein